MVGQPEMCLCSICGEKFSTEKLLKSHLASHTLDLTCTACNREYSRKESFLYHMQQYHPEIVNEKVFSCKKCCKAFASEGSLEKHLVIHSGAFRCSVCNKTFAREKGLLKHKCTGTDDAEGEIPSCDVCGAQFSKMKSYKRHIMGHTQTFPCQSCNRIYARKETLLFHMKRCDPDGLKRVGFPCHLCNKAFVKESSLMSHMAFHSDAHHCSKCGKRFTRKERLLNHECLPEKTSDNKVKDLKCPFCSLTFTNDKNLTRHMVRHSTSFQCKTCEKSFSRKQSLWYHLRKCNPKAIEEDCFPCNQCKKVFNKEQSLLSHQVVHSDKFRCDYCQKGFSGMTKLANHFCPVNGKLTESDLAKMIGDGSACVSDNTIASHYCKLCGEQFELLSDLKEHKLAIHVGNFVCVWCGSRFLSEGERSLHVNQCDQNKEGQTYTQSYPCFICNEVFADSSLLQDHISMHKSLEGGDNTLNIECIACPEHFSDVLLFREHYRNHKPPFKCRNCRQQFQIRYYFELHNCEVDIVNRVKCEVCQKSFRNSELLKCHRLVYDQVRYTCDRCDQVFHSLEVFSDHLCRTKDGLKKRVKRSGGFEYVSTVRSCVCSVCGKVLSSHGNLKKHMEYHKQKNHKCKVCGKAFHLKEGVDRHMITHSDKLQFPCPYCSKLLKSRDSLRSHIRGLHMSGGYRFECDKCGRRFQQKGNMKKHRLIHLPNKQFHCKICPKTFTFNQQLQKHLLWHKNGAQFRCHMCMKKFVIESELRYHIKQYHNDITYHCPFCDVLCRHRYTMLRHLRRKHPNADWTDDLSYVDQLASKEPDKEIIHRHAPAIVGELLDEPPDSADIELGDDKVSTAIEIPVGANIEEISEVLREMDTDYFNEERLIIIIPNDEISVSNQNELSIE